MIGELVPGQDRVTSWLASAINTVRSVPAALGPVATSNRERVTGNRITVYHDSGRTNQVVAQSATTTSARTGHLVVGRALIGDHWPRAHDATIGVVRMVMASSLVAVRTLIADILREDQTATAAPRICAAVTSAAPCEGAEVTIMTADGRRESLYVSDPLIAQYQRAQLTLGEGPGLHAFTNVTV